MGDMAVSASDARENFAEYLEQSQLRRVVVTKYGKEFAYLISVREMRAIEETLAVLSNEELMRSVARGLDDLKHGRVRPAEDVFAEIEAESP